MAYATRVTPYAIISLALDDARDSAAQNDLTVEGETISDWVANTITILTLDGGSLDFALSQLGADIPASDGLKVEGVRFSNIYWTHGAQPGLTAVIFVAWVD